jgi:hypothetical protein
MLTMLTEKQKQEIRTRYAANPKKDDYATLAKQYGVSKATISYVIKGRKGIKVEVTPYVNYVNSAVNSVNSDVNSKSQDFEDSKVGKFMGTMMDHAKLTEKFQQWLKMQNLDNYPADMKAQLNQIQDHSRPSHNTGLLRLFRIFLEEN